MLCDHICILRDAVLVEEYDACRKMELKPRILWTYGACDNSTYFCTHF